MSLDRSQVQSIPEWQKQARDEKAASQCFAACLAPNQRLSKNQYSLLSDMQTLPQRPIFFFKLSLRW